MSAVITSRGPAHRARQQGNLDDAMVTHQQGYQSSGELRLINDLQGGPVIDSIKLTQPAELYVHMDRQAPPASSYPRQISHSWSDLTYIHHNSWLTSCLQ